MNHFAYTKESIGMLFTSMEFLFLFFPIVLGIYFFLPMKARNYWLFLVSLFFYAWGEPVFVLFMLFSILFNYLAAVRIEELENDRNMRKVILAITVFVNLGMLFVYKYMNFTTSNLQKLFEPLGFSIEITEYVLPIGISFFTFQALSYVIDVYRGIPAQKNPAYLGLYISLFPQLIAGPIVRYTTVMNEIEHRKTTWDGFCHGMLRFLYGFNKKMLLANLFAKVADAAFAAEELSIGFAWFGALCYSLQIFFDFSGYSEMAIGLGEMFGFHFLENFNYPYSSKTVTEFWRRWHISLGSWFRDYVYFPLGGSRVNSKARLIFNLAVVWLATGIWHGANWTFLFWGVLHGIIIVIEKLFSLPGKIEKRKWTSAGYRVITLLVVVVGWVLFRAENLSQAVHYIKTMFAMGNASFWCQNATFYIRENALLFIIGILCAVPFFKGITEIMEKKNEKMSVLCGHLDVTVQLLLFIVSVSFLVMNAHNPFIYFNF